MTTPKPDVQALIEEGRNAQKYAFSMNDTGNALIFRALTDALSALSGETETEWEYGVRYSDQSERLLGTRKNAESHLHEDLFDTLIRRTRARPVPAGPWEVVV